MRTLLVNPRCSGDYYRDTGIKLIPYGIVYLAAYGRERGHHFVILDRNVDARSLEDMVRELTPGVVGLSVMTGPCLRDAVEISRTLRRLFPEVKIVWGGIHPTLLYEQVLQENLCDIAVIGEGEQTFVEILEALEKKDRVETIFGIAYSKGGKIVRTEAREYIGDLNALPDPAWDLVPMERYSFLTLNTSRGCPFRCTFCYNQKMNGKRRSEFSAERVLGLVRRLHEEYGAGHVDFLEDNFTAGWRRVNDFCELMEKSGLGVTWACEGRVSGMTREKLELMKRGGCKAIRFGVESGSPKILEFLKKDITPGMAGQVIRESREVGLTTSIYLINGVPGETREDRRKSIELLYRDKPDYVEVTTYRPYPGTELHDYCINQGLFTPPARTEDWAVISDQYDPRFDVSGVGWRELKRFQARAMRFMEKGKRWKKMKWKFQAPIRVCNKVWRKIFSARDPRRPIHSINLETCRVCNLKCVQCVVHAEDREIGQYLTHPNDRGMLTVETLERLEPILQDVRILNLDNHGEPLMNPALEDIIARARALAPHLKITLTSNFMLMTRKRAEGLLAAGLNEVQVSVNGIRKETYEKVMKGATYERFVEHLEGFAEARKLSRWSLKTFSACMTTMRSNVAELKSLPGFLAGFGVDEIRINTILPFNQKAQVESLYDRPEYREEFERILEQTREECSRRGIRMLRVVTGETTALCRYSAGNFAVGYDGSVYPCWMLDIPEGYGYYYKGKKYSLPFVCYGNINDRPIKETWELGEWRKLREDFSKGRVPEYCRRCPVGAGRICG